MPGDEAARDASPVFQQLEHLGFSSVTAVLLRAIFLGTSARNKIFPFFHVLSHPACPI
jgi:hypothetical protein